MTARGSLMPTSLAAEHAAARWHHAKRAMRLRGQLKLTIADIDELLCRTDGDLRRDLAVIRRRLDAALRDDREMPQ